jgi:hypothetical protein
MTSQTSGSITLDVSALADSVLTGLNPVMAQINGNLERLSGLLAAAALDEDAAVDVLQQYLPVRAEANGDYADNRATAGYLAEHLAQQGYALVAVNGPALERELARNGFTGVATVPVVDPAEAQRAREEQWFADGRED